MPNSLRPPVKRRVDLRVLVRRRPDDPEGITRVSCGGTLGNGFYCCYRGERLEAVLVLRAAIAALENSPEVEPVPDADQT